MSGPDSNEVARAKKLLQMRDTGSLPRRIAVETKIRQLPAHVHAAATAQAAPEGGSPADKPAPSGPPLEHSVQTVLADVTGSGLSGLAADLGVEADELSTIVNDPDFEREVREAAARLTAG